MNLLEKADLAEQTALAAGEMLEHHGKLQIRVKSENDFVTEMDLASEQLIRKRLLEACPEDEFFGEETGGSTDCEGRWIVDPIDGTTNFMRGIRIYCISIAYEYKGELVIGCVYSPGTNELFKAVKGRGATLNGKPIHVTDTSDLSISILAMAFAHRNADDRKRTFLMLPKLAESVSDLRRSGTCAYDLCNVAAGRVDGYMELGLHIYDYAAGFVILEEAGGKYSGWTKDDNVFETGNILASNTILHEDIRKIITLQ